MSVNKGGRPKGAKSARYVSVHAMQLAIQDALGCSYVDALGEMLLQLRNQFDEAITLGNNRDINSCKYPDVMMSLATKLVASHQLEPESADLEELSDEELTERARVVAKQVLEQAAPQAEAA